MSSDNNKLATASVDATTLSTSNEVEEKKVSKKNLTMYWGVMLDTGIFQKKEIQDALSSHPELIPLSKIHSTILFVGKKNTEELQQQEARLAPFEGQQCEVIISGFGMTENALALSVESITYCGQPMPTFPPKKLHVTMALKKGIAAKDSVEVFFTEGATIVKFEEPIVLHGTVKRNLF